jgi:RNA polymerase sigma-70 factor, ECF subfamily
VKSEVLRSLWEPGPKGAPETGDTARPHFDEVYEVWFEKVALWVAALGGPPGDRDDLVQDVFVVVLRRLPSFDGQNLPGWLYQITRRRVRDFRRLTWFRRMLFRDASSLDTLIHALPRGADAAEIHDQRRLLDHLLNTLGEEQRAAFVLFEIEGYSGEEIACMQGVPVNTVWARIHTARKKLSERLSKLHPGVARRRAS